ncbi:D-alanyl-D-alanine carboxypeptidase/D-alanyl-D-alanine-endopeptidase [Streptomyces hirsutus]
MREVGPVVRHHPSTRAAKRHPIGVNPNLAALTPLMADEARRDNSAAGPADRVADPAADAARKFAVLLKENGIKATPPGPSKSTTRAGTLAAVSLRPLATMKRIR